MKISEMTIGQRVEGRLVLAGATVRTTKGNPPRPFLSATLTDGMDTIDCVLWNYRDPNGIPELCKVHDITGNVTEYNGKKQLTLTTLGLSADQNIAEFSRTYIEDLDAAWAAVMQRIARIQNKQLGDITLRVYDKFKDPLMNAPSAKSVHHVGIGGNLCHTIEVFDYANGIVPIVQHYGLQVDADLVRAGALLHDIGKMFTYGIDGAVVDYTTTGRLLDHIGLGAGILLHIGSELGADYTDSIMLLQHIILSHHGQLELGSPVTPKFAEAYIVNIADGISARMDALKGANTKAECEHKPFTDRIFSLGNSEHILQSEVNSILCLRS